MYFNNAFSLISFYGSRLSKLRQKLKNACDVEAAVAPFAVRILQIIFTVCPANQIIFDCRGIYKEVVLVHYRPLQKLRAAACSDCRRNACAVPRTKRRGDIDARRRYIGYNHAIFPKTASRRRRDTDIGGLVI